MKSMTSFERDGKFSRYTAAGNDNPTWKGKSIIDLLKTVVVDAGTTPEQKERALDILAYVARMHKRLTLEFPDAPEASLMMERIDAGALWDFYPRWEILTDKDGVERVREIEPQAITAPTKPAPEPQPEPEVEQQEPDEPLTGEAKLKAAKEWAKTL
jgi:hypothetical protein